MPYLSVDEENSAPIDLYYEDYGAGSPVVLIHGWPLSSASWEKQIAGLLQAGHRVVAYDRRGFGNSSKPASGYDYDTLARDLHRLLTQLDLRAAVLVGFAMGAGEVARYVSTYGSRRLRKVAFVSALLPYLLKTPDNPSGVDGTFFAGISARIASDRYAFLSAFLADFYNLDVLGGERVSHEVVRASWNVGASASAQGFAGSVPAWLTDFRGDVNRIDVPALIVHGTADRVLPLASTGARLHSALAGSRLLTLADAPHGLIWTHAEAVNAALVDFLK